MSELATDHSLDELLFLEQLDFIEKAKDGNFMAFNLAIDPSYIVTWFNKVLAEYLEAYARGEIRRLMIEMPPRHGKSQQVSRLLPAFLLGINPDRRILQCSYSSSLATRMNLDVQRVMQHPVYKMIFEDTMLASDSRITDMSIKTKLTDHFFEIYGRKGSCRASGVLGAMTGMGFDDLIIDDPHKNRAEADSDVARAKVHSAYSADIITRLQTGGGAIICQTRWHEMDLIGHLLDKAKNDPKADQWTVVSLPAIKTHHDNADDIRELGEALWPEKYDLDFLLSRKADNARDFASLYQQTPFVQGGLIVQSSWWKFHTESNRPAQLDDYMVSIDANFKEADTSDPVVIQVWARKHPNYYLLREWRSKVGFTGTLPIIDLAIDIYRQVGTILVEAKANGQAIIDVLSDRYTGVIPYVPKESKESRLASVAPMIEAGNVWLPHPSEAHWVPEYIDEFSKFPSGKHDDRVDCTSQALIRYGKSVFKSLEGLIKR